jgi:excinuclease ABC subunit C
MALTLEQHLELIPTTPGVYQFKDAAGKILYVGKAKLLRSRVRSYFQPGATLDEAKQQMVKKVATIETISTDTEHEALVLEANLIQQHQPPYNVILRDDKYYLFIKITREDWPRVFLTRRLHKDGARYFGPYSSAQSVRATLKLLRRIFPHRTEKELAHDMILPHPLFRTGEGLLQDSLNDAAAYQKNIEAIIRFLKGDREAIMQTLREGMEKAAAQHSFEQAALFRDQFQAVARLDEQQKVYLPNRENLDVISLARDASRSAANVFSIRRGKLLQKNTFLLRHRASTNSTDTLRQFILQYYRVAQDIPPLILIPETLEDSDALAQWINTENPPQLITAHRGVKRQLIEMGELNARQLLERDAIELLTTKRAKDAVRQLAESLGLGDRMLHRIETYDISNIQGKLATGSMVVFIDGKPEPKQYKKFRIRLGETPNDFAMLQEVLARRFAQRNEEWPKPDLIMIDGGKGQLSAGLQVLEQLKVTIPTIALAKQEEEIFLPGRADSLRLPHDSEALYLIQRMRDEAHRFTITYHRTLRSKRQQESRLDDIPGIGPKTRQRLLRHFGSLQAVRNATDEELAKVIGSKAKILREYW